jgi:hypothetical protein
MQGGGLGGAIIPTWIDVRHAMYGSVLIPSDVYCDAM